MPWSSLEPLGFPDYVLNEYGHVQSFKNKRLIKPSYNQYGFPYVQIRDSDGQRRARGTASLVAHLFLDDPSSPADNTLIRKDGDKVNTHVDNLAWRTRSYAINYHRDLEINVGGLFNYPVYSLESGSGRHVRFNTMREAAIYYGVREVELFDNMAAGVPVHYASHVTMYKN